MKNLRKALAAVLALSVISVSGSALAETGCTLTGDLATFDATYDAEANSLTAEVLSGATIGEQMTFVILDQGADEKDEIEADDILYIDQKELTAYGDSFTGVINLARVNGATDAMPDGSYPVRLGYMTSAGFKMATGDLVIESTPSGVTVEFKWGDITGDNTINSQDALAALLYFVGTANTYKVATYDATVGSDFAGYKWGDLTGDNTINSQDALAALLYFVGTANTYTVNGESLTVGNTVQGTIAAE